MVTGKRNSACRKGVNAMNSLKPQKDELERQRLMLVSQLYKLLDELEGPRAPRRRTSRFPFDVLEGSINSMLLKLEDTVDKLVAAVLDIHHRR